MPRTALPQRPPFTLRARLLTPLGAGGYRYESDARVDVDDGGRIAAVTAWSTAADAIDLRPWLILPGMVDLHLHLPQLPNAGLGAGLDLLTWLERYIFPLERDFDRSAAERLAPAAFQAMAAAGTTTALMYGAVFEPSLDAAFEAAEAHGIRAVIGKVMMDRLRYDPSLPEASVLETSLRQSADLIDRWHGRDNGRLRYAVTPRFAVSCSADMLRESAALARETGAYWQTHLAEDREEIAEVHRLFPDALDYTDVYDRAGGLGERTVLAHAIHLSDREITRLADTSTRIAHCPSSNLFLASGAMPLGRYLDAGLVIGLGSDVSAGPDLSLFAVMRAGAYTQSGLRTMLDDHYSPLAPPDWLRLGSLEGARALGLAHAIGSVEVGKEADLIVVDPALTAPLPHLDAAEPEEIASRLIFRSHPNMVRAAWVRGRRLDGPPNA
ncbi:MAG: guanine deaminase [Chloroflexi bacterium]|nr:MAG: guanine deaminase [Chloroflexota bacterium]